MKKLLYIMLLLALTSSLTMSCDDKIDTAELTEDEYPRILGRWPDKKENGDLGDFDIPLNEILTIALQFTPSKYCTGVWYIDGQEVETGTVLEYVPTAVGTYKLDLVVTTPKHKTTREAYIKVIPATN